MKLTRRTLLKLGCGGLILGIGGGFLARLYSRRYVPLGAHDNWTIDVICELIVPADDLSPGARELDVPQAVFAEASGNRRLRRLIVGGVKQLDRIANATSDTDFIDMSEVQQTAVLESIDLAEANTIESKFFRRIRELTFSHYYAQPESWVSLNYFGPPQPRGFMDYVSPPQGRGPI